MSPIDDRGSDYPYHLQPLAFPETLARAAQNACNTVISLLRTDLDQRPGWVTVARDSWSGPHRVKFDASWAKVSGATHDTKDSLTKLVNAIDTALANVARENRRRTTAREQWDKDHGRPTSGSW